MKVRIVLLLVICCALGLMISFSGSNSGQTQSTKSSTADGMSQAEQELLTEINLARTNPQQYVSYLEGLKPFYKDKQYNTATLSVTTQEGWAAVEDAIKFLRATKPLAPLSMSRGLCNAALSHIKDQSGTGATGHKGADNSLIEQRVKPFGTWQGGIGENLTYGNESARERVLTWLIDDGFATRGHRVRLLSPDYRVAGVCCGPHPEFQSMCAITLAGGFVDLQTAKSSTTQTAAPANKPAAKSRTRLRKH